MIMSWGDFVISQSSISSLILFPTSFVSGAGDWIHYSNIELQWELQKLKKYIEIIQFLDQTF